MVISSPQLEKLLTDAGYAPLLPGEFLHRYRSSAILVSRMYAIVPGLKRPGPSSPQIGLFEVIAMTNMTDAWVRKMLRDGYLHTVNATDRTSRNGKKAPERLTFDTIEVMAFLWSRHLLDDEAA
jgi:hypothetical protein